MVVNELFRYAEPFQIVSSETTHTGRPFSRASGQCVRDAVFQWRNLPIVLAAAPLFMSHSGVVAEIVSRISIKNKHIYP